MPKTNLGRVSVVPKGEYNPTVQYERLDVISYKDNSYMVLKPVKGIEPINDNINYMLIAGYTHSEEFTNLAEQVRADAVNAQTSEINAKQSETSAKQSAEQSKQSETNAKNSQDDVILKASQVAEDLIKTNNNVTTTETAKNEAIKQADLASKSATASKSSEDNAKISETNAKTSETNAKQSETNAKQSADNAKQSELKAKTSEVLSVNNAKLADVIAIKQNVKGNPIQISDSANYGFLDYEINGTTTQDGTPTPENPVEIVNGSITDINISNGADISKTITLSQPVELSKWDRIIKKNGVWGKENNTATEIFDGSADEDYSIWSFNNTVYLTRFKFRYGVSGYDHGYEYVYCNKLKSLPFRSISRGQSGGNQYAIAIAEDGETTVYLNIPSVSNNIAGCKEWLKSNPINIIYKTAEPIFEPLPEIDQQALNSLETYYPETVVTTQGEQSLTYLADTKTYISPVLYNNAGAHNSVYRGKNLGTSVTAEQWTNIKNGTFKNLYVGDYWKINGVTYLIAGFNYFYNTGDIACTQNHVNLMPLNNMYNAKMNETNTTDGGYLGMDMHMTGLDKARDTVAIAFGTEHILKHRLYLSNAVTNGKVSGGVWADCTVELPTEEMIYGGNIFTTHSDGSKSIPQEVKVGKSQLPLFTFRPDLISSGYWFWLQNVVSPIHFALVDGDGCAHYHSVTNMCGVRPLFSIC